MKRNDLVLAVGRACTATSQAKDRVVSLMDKFDKRMDVLDTKIAGMEAQLKALKAMKAKAEPKGYTPSYAPQPKTPLPKTPMPKGMPPLPPGFHLIECDGEIIIIGPPPWALPNGPPPGFFPGGPFHGGPSRFAGNPSGW